MLHARQHDLGDHEEHVDKAFSRDLLPGTKAF
jgi:hypothetical protein